MSHRLSRWSVSCVAALVALVAAKSPGAELTYKDAEGLIRVNVPAIPEELRNPAWPAAMETAYWKRVNHVLSERTGKAVSRTDGEGEKWAYPALFLDYLAGFKDSAILGLTAEDQQRNDNAFTQGIDYYWSFTIKGQTRKYFLFGDKLPKEYRQRMFEGGKAWTAEDPRPLLELVLSLESKDPMVREYALSLLRKMGKASKTEPKKAIESEVIQQRNAEFVQFVKGTPANMEGVDFGEDVAGWRQWWSYWAAGGWKVFEEFERVINPRPHPIHGVGSGPTDGQAWQAGVRGGVVDPRCTDNLRAMRETSVYLMAEETGNEKVRRLYKDKIRRQVRAWYTIGMGEWDSENYHAHTMMPYLSLYDFAKDPEVKAMAKAGLDWLSMAAALKYYRGGYGGPTKRDYNGARRVFGSGPSHLMYLWFGDCPIPDPNFEEDLAHAITSAYRPPLVVAALATRNFKRPVELWNTKPTYSNWTPGADEKPEYWETLFYGDSYYLGTAVSPTRTTGGEGGDDVGALKLLAHNSQYGADYFLASSGKDINKKYGFDRIGQYRNMAIFLRKGDDKPFTFQIPKAAASAMDGDIWFIGMEKTFLAVRPIGLDVNMAGVAGKGGKNDPNALTLSAKQTGAPLSGFALLVGDTSEFKDFNAFRQAVKSRSKLVVPGDAKGMVVLTGVDGRKLEMGYNAAGELPIVVRDGKARDWMNETDLYKTVDAPAGAGLVSLSRRDGTLRIEAGGQVFTQTVTPEGKVTWSTR